MTFYYIHRLVTSHMSLMRLHTELNHIVFTGLYKFGLDYYLYNSRVRSLEQDRYKT